MTPITYKDASILLGVKVDALRNAAFRGVLTRMPRTGTMQPLIREQVELFNGKGRLSLHVLNAQEKEIWARYAQAEIKQPAQAEIKQPAQATESQGQSSPAFTSDMLIGAAFAGVALAGAIPALQNVEVPQGNPFLVLLNSLKITR